MNFIPQSPIIPFDVEGKTMEELQAQKELYTTQIASNNAKVEEQEAKFAVEKIQIEKRNQSIQDKIDEIDSAILVFNA